MATWSNALKKAGKAIATGGFSLVADAVKDNFSNNKKSEKVETQKSTSLPELQKQGREMAGQAAADKAGEAKRAAKAATMQTSGNKLAAATNAAAAAGNAASQGYADTANQMTSLAVNQEQSDLNRQAQTDQFNAKMQEDRYQKQKDRNATMFSSALGAAGAGIGGALSDETKKKTKHTYIPVEKRLNRKGEENA